MTLPEKAGWIQLQDNRTRRIAFLGLFAAAAILLGYVESMIPINFGIPGIKLGLCNIAILLVLNFYSWKEAILVTVVRILVIGFLFGNLFSIAYALAGALLSIICMSFLFKTRQFGILGISAAGGAAHNLGQVLVACVILRGFPWQMYLPILLLAGVGTGLITGGVAWMVGSRLPRKMMEI